MEQAVATGAGPAVLRWDRIVLGLAAVQCAAALLAPWVSAGPWEVHAFRDDAYYQFAVARSLAAGQGFTLDGVHAAGGVQVLWTLLLALPAAILGPAAIPVAAAVLGSALHLLASLLVLRLASPHAPRVVAWGIAAYFASRPPLVTEALNGQETALAVFVLLVWARRATSVAGGGRTSPRGLLVWTVLLPWARTDLLAFPAGLALWNLVAPLFGGTRRPFGLNEVSLTASLVVYLVLQKLCFGGWIPVSGFAIPWLFHVAFAAREPGFGEVARRYWWFVRPVLLGGPFTVAGFGFGLAACWSLLAPLGARRRLLPLFAVAAAALLGARDLGAPFLAALLLVFTGGAARALWTDREGRAVLGLWTGFVLLLVLHLPLRWYPRDYYFVPGAVCGVLTIAVAAGRWLGEGFVLSLVPVGRRLAAFWVVLLLLLPADTGFARNRFPWQEEMSFAARWASRAVGDRAGIGAFNAGLLAWEHRGPVRNLDGVVDGAALPALRKGILAQWIAGEGIDYVLDSPRQVADDDPDPIAPHASGRRLGPKGRAELVPLLAFDLPGVGGRHPGTDCQVLYGLPGAPAPDLGPSPILERRAGAVVVVLPTRDGEGIARYVLEQDGRERPLQVAESARAAPFVVTRIRGSGGRVSLGGRRVLDW